MAITMAYCFVGLFFVCGAWLKKDRGKKVLPWCDFVFKCITLIRNFPMQIVLFLFRPNKHENLLMETILRHKCCFYQNNELPVGVYLCPLRIVSNFSFNVFHIKRLPSALPLATKLASGLKQERDQFMPILNRSSENVLMTDNWRTSTNLTVLSRDVVKS
jgi:hypothetical protein